MTIIIPAVDIMGGKCVRLVKGDPDAATVFGNDPVEVARQFAASGARRLHVVDLDAALGRPAQGLAVLEALVNATGLSVQFGGGLRSLESLRQARLAGATWVITGTAGLADQSFLASAAAEHGENLIVALDVRDGRLLVSGWREGAALTMPAALEAGAACGVRRLMITDAGADGTLGGVDPGVMQPALGRGFRLVAAGGVAGTGDVRRLVAAGGPDLEGIVIGSALLRGRLSLAEAQAAAEEEVCE